MAPLNAHFLKPLLPVGNVPIMGHQLLQMARLGVRHAVIVAGHRKEQIGEFLHNGDKYGLEVSLVEQHERLGIAHAVLELEGRIPGPFILFLGDIFLIAPRLNQMVEGFFRQDRGAALAARWETDASRLSRNFLIFADMSGNARRVIEKPQGVRQGLKGCGVYVFDETIFDAIRRTPRSSRRNEYEITDSIQILIDDGVPVSIHRVVDWDMNVTFTQDVLECNLEYLSRNHLCSLVAPDVAIPRTAHLSRCVVGSGARIGDGAIIEESVVFPGAAVTPGSSLRRVIVTPQGTLQFGQGGQRRGNELP